MGPRAVGAARRGHHLRRHGELAAVAGRRATQLLTDVLADNAKVVLVEPRRMRDRATDLLAEEDDLARTLAGTWGRDPDAPFPRLHAETDRLLGGDRVQMWTHRPDAREPRRADRRGQRLGAASSATATGWPTGSRRCSPTEYRVVVAADGEGSAQRLAELLRDRGLDFTSTRRGDADRPHPPGRLRRRSPRCTAARTIPSGQAGDRRRGRPHRPAPHPSPAAAAQARAAGFFEDLKPGNYVVHYQHGVGKYEGMVKRTIGGIERDYLLLALQGRRQAVRARATRSTRCASTSAARRPTLHRLGGADFAKAKARVALGGARDRPGARRAVPEAGQRRRLRVRAGHAVAARDGGGVPVRGDARPAQGDRRRQGRHGARRTRWTACVCGDVGFGKTEVAIRAAFKAIQDGKQVAVLAPTTLLATQHGNTFADRFAGYPIRVEVLSRFLTNGAGQEGDRRARSPARSTASSAPTACCRTASASRTSACSSSTRSSASACSTRRR